MTSTQKRVSLILDECKGDLDRRNALHCLLRWVVRAKNPKTVMLAFIVECLARSVKDKQILKLCGVFCRNYLSNSVPSIVSCIDILDLDLPFRPGGSYLGSNASGYHYFWTDKGELLMDSKPIPYSKTSYGWRLVALAGFVPLKRIKWTVSI